MFFYLTPKIHPPSITFINRRTNPKLIPNWWASLNYEFENSILRGCAPHHFLQLVNNLIPKSPSQYLYLLDLFEYLSFEMQEVEGEKVNLGFLQVPLMTV